MLYSSVVRNVLQRADGVVAVTDELFKFLLRQAILTTEFDDAWYLQKYDDVREAIASGRCESARYHFFDTGYFEGRMPREIIVDEDFYLKSNPDVADAIKRGDLKDAQEHFERSGMYEGRVPYDNFSLFSSETAWINGGPKQPNDQDANQPKRTRLGSI